MLNKSRGDIGGAICIGIVDQVLAVNNLLAGNSGEHQGVLSEVAG